MDKPFLLQVPDCKDRALQKIDNSVLGQSMQSFHQAHSEVFRRFPGFEKDPKIPETFIRMDFRRFDPLGYRCVIASGILLALEAQNGLRELKEKCDYLFQRYFIDQDPAQRACRYIWYANRFFVKMNEAYPNFYRDCLRAHQTLIDAWFAGLEEDSFPGQSRSFADTLKAIVRNGLMLDPLLTWWVIQGNTIQNLQKILENQSLEQVAFEHLDRFVSDKCLEMTFSCAIDSSKLAILKMSLLSLLLSKHPYAAIVLDQYSDYLGGKRHE